MPLDPSALASQLEDIMGAHQPKSPAEAADRWSAAYASWAQNATSPAGGSPIDVSASQGIMRAALTAAFASPVGPAPATAAAIAQAVVAFWVPVIFTGPVPGTVVTSVAAGPVLQAGLLGLWPGLAVSKASAKLAAQQHAPIFLAATVTVVVIHILPPPAPPIVGPIS